MISSGTYGMDGPPGARREILRRVDGDVEVAHVRGDAALAAPSLRDLQQRHGLLLGHGGALQVVALGDEADAVVVVAVHSRWHRHGEPDALVRTRGQEATLPLEGRQDATE
jgi:hypothetical protein